MEHRDGNARWESWESAPGGGAPWQARQKQFLLIINGCQTGEPEGMLLPLPEKTILPYRGYEEAARKMEAYPEGDGLPRCPYGTVKGAASFLVKFLFYQQGDWKGEVVWGRHRRYFKSTAMLFRIVAEEWERKSRIPVHG